MQRSIRQSIRPAYSIDPSMPPSWDNLTCPILLSLGDLSLPTPLAAAMRWPRRRLFVQDPCGASMFTPVRPAACACFNTYGARRGREDVHWLHSKNSGIIRTPRNIPAVISCAVKSSRKIRPLRTHAWLCSRPPCPDPCSQRGGCGRRGWVGGSHVSRP